MAKVTIYDIAKKLNVSTASVTRALNGLPKVSEEKRRLIIQTAEEMGYSANKLAVSLSRKPVKIAVILYASIEDFYNKISAGIDNACTGLEDFNIENDTFIFNTQKHSDSDVLKALEEVGRKRYNGLLIHSIHDSPEISAAVADLMNKGITVYTINTDLSVGRKHFCVMNNASVSGKMAAELLDWSVANRKICYFMGSKDTRALASINESFLDEAEKRKLQIVGRFYDNDSPREAIKNIDTMLLRYPDTGGIYINSAISYVMCNHLIEQGKAKNLRIVTSDLLPDIVRHIKDDTIQATIFQNPYLQGHLGFMNLYKIIAEKASIDEEIFVDPIILSKSNIDLYA